MIYEVRIGDCCDPETGLASLPDASIDHLISDPPYDPHTHANGVRGIGHRPGSSKAIDLGFDPMTPELMRGVAREAARVTRRWVLIFCSVEHLSAWREQLIAAGLEYVRAGAWVKQNPSPQFTGDRPAIGFESIVIAHRRGRKRWNGGGRPAVWTTSTAYRDGDVMLHTTQKPLALMEALVRDFTDPGETVADPFLGSGTTGVACKRLGRQFIGWDLDALYASAARQRIAETAQQFTLDDASARARAKQSCLFDFGAGEAGGVGDGQTGA